MRTILAISLRTGLISGAALALSACGGGTDAPEPAPSERPSVEEPVSIFRPDAPIERVAPPLEPLDQTVSFSEGGSELSEAALASLAEILASPQMEADGAITLRGHTDSEGNDAANLRASQRRADAVRDWLVENGVAEGRIVTIAMGEQNPAEPNANDDGSPNEIGRAANRRVEVVIAVPADQVEAVEEQPTLIEQVSSED